MGGSAVWSHPCGSFGERGHRLRQVHAREETRRVQTQVEHQVVRYAFCRFPPNLHISAVRTFQMLCVHTTSLSS